MQLQQQYRGSAAAAAPAFLHTSQNCRSNCSQLFPGCSCSCSPRQLRSASQTAVAAVPKNFSRYKLQLQLSESCTYPGLSPTKIESASETAAGAQDGALQQQFHRLPHLKTASLQLELQLKLPHRFLRLQLLTLREVQGQLLNCSLIMW